MWAAAGVVAAAAVVAGIALTRASSHPATTRTTPTPVRYVAGDVSGKLVYGMTKQQVERRVGKPTTTLRDETGTSCWQYAVNHTYRAFGSTHTENAVRICFVDGVYSVSHTETDGKWDYVGATVTLG